jgi:hypothetical protein
MYPYQEEETRGQVNDEGCPCGSPATVADSQKQCDNKKPGERVNAEVGSKAGSTQQVRHHCHQTRSESVNERATQRGSERPTT